MVRNAEHWSNYVFDFLMPDGKDLRHLPLVKRKHHLDKLLTGHPRLLEVEHIEHDGLSLFAGAITLGLEGIVAKDAKVLTWKGA